jgi:hypothetical protein
MRHMATVVGTTLMILSIVVTGLILEH